MTSPDGLAREAFDTICNAMPTDLQPARAPVEARRHLLGLTENLPERHQKKAHAALERLIEERFGSQEVQPRPPAAVTALEKDAPSLETDLAFAVGDAFATTFDGTVEMADEISKGAWATCERVMEMHKLTLFARWRARRKCRTLIADERARLFD